MKKYDWKNEYNPIRRTAKRLLSGEPLTDGRPLSDLIELDEHTRKCLAFEATLTDRQIDMILSRLVDTFISRISLTMLPVPNPHNTVCVLSWEEARHWQSRSSGYSSS